MITTEQEITTMKLKRSPARPAYAVWVFGLYESDTWHPAGRYDSERQARAAAAHIERTQGRRCRTTFEPEA